jgi:protein-S-isoprenylcysteine O-methyltransferase Ste14
VRALELKIPPPVVALIIAIAMWSGSFVLPRLEMAPVFRSTAVVSIAVAALAFAVTGVLAFRRARTTLNPLEPQGASSLVTSGVYRVTRNPMYLGLTLALLAWAVFLTTAFALLGPVAFVLYTNRFQIVPEERALAKLFGSAFADYQAKVRRWL